MGRSSEKMYFRQKTRGEAGRKNAQRALEISVSLPCGAHMDLCPSDTRPRMQYIESPKPLVLHGRWPWFLPGHCISLVHSSCEHRKMSKCPVRRSQSAWPMPQSGRILKSISLGRMQTLINWFRSRKSWTIWEARAGGKMCRFAPSCSCGDCSIDGKWLGNLGSYIYKLKNKSFAFGHLVNLKL